MNSSRSRSFHSLISKSGWRRFQDAWHRFHDAGHVLGRARGSSAIWWMIFGTSFVFVFVFAFVFVVVVFGREHVIMMKIATTATTATSNNNNISYQTKKKSTMDYFRPSLDDRRGAATYFCQFVGYRDLSRLGRVGVLVVLLLMASTALFMMFLVVLLAVAMGGGELFLVVLLVFVLNIRYAGSYPSRFVPMTKTRRRTSSHMTPTRFLTRRYRPVVAERVE